MKKWFLIFLLTVFCLVPSFSLAGSLTNYGEDAWMGHLFGSAYSPVATIYVALATANPDETATGASMNECANSGSYARKAIAFNPASSRKVVQNGVVTFDQATGSWGTVSHWALVDSGTYGAGNVLAYGAFTASFEVVSGNTPSIADTQIQVQISASSGEGFTDYLVHKMLDLIFRNTAYSQPTTCIALLDTTGADTDTTLTGAGKEVAGTDYARILVNKVGGGSPAWTTINGGATDNGADVTFPTVGSGGWGQVVAMAIADNCTLDTGNVLAYDNDQVVDQTPNAGDTVKFPTGSLDVSIQ
jgi:hypothetical protein